MVVGNPSHSIACPKPFFYFSFPVHKIECFYGMVLGLLIGPEFFLKVKF